MWSVLKAPKSSILTFKVHCFGLLQWQKCLDMTYDSFKLLVFRVKNEKKVVVFSAAVKRVEGSRNYGYHEHIHAPQPVWVESGRWWMWQHVATGEPRDKICEIVPVRFKPDMWKHFGFSMSRNDKGGNLFSVMLNIRMRQFYISCIRYMSYWSG